MPKPHHAHRERLSRIPGWLLLASLPMALGLASAESAADLVFRRVIKLDKAAKRSRYVLVVDPVEPAEIRLRVRLGGAGLDRFAARYFERHGGIEAVLLRGRIVAVHKDAGDQGEVEPFWRLAAPKRGMTGVVPGKLAPGQVITIANVNELQRKLDGVRRKPRAVRRSHYVAVLEAEIPTLSERCVLFSNYYERRLHAFQGLAGRGLADLAAAQAVLKQLASPANTPNALPSASRWSPKVNGLRIRASTDRSTYTVGEHIYLTLKYHNHSAQDQVIVVNGVSGARGPGPDQFKECPLYSADRLEVIFSGRDHHEAFVLYPLESTMFPGRRWEVTKPGGIRIDTVRLDTWAWREKDSSNRWRPHSRVPRIGRPGTYQITVFYRASALKPVAREQLRRFFARPAADPARFAHEGIQDISFNEAKRLQPWDWRLWEGAIRAPQLSFVIAPVDEAR